MAAESAVDDRPDRAIKGRKVTPEWRKRREAKRARRFVMVEWGELVPALQALGVNRAARLLMVLYLHANLKKVRATAGWIELVLHDLQAVGLGDNNLNRDVARLETAGVVEVQRRLGKRPLLRLIKQSERQVRLERRRAIGIAKDSEP
jgi:hypothetical protein